MLFFVIDDEPLNRDLLRQLSHAFRSNRAYTPTSAALLKTAFTTLFREPGPHDDSAAQFECLREVRDAQTPYAAARVADAILTEDRYGRTFTKWVERTLVGAADTEAKVQALLGTVRGRAFRPISERTVSRAMNAECGCNAKNVGVISLALTEGDEALGWRKVGQAEVRSARPSTTSPPTSLMRLAKYVSRSKVVVSRAYVQAAVAVLGNDRYARRLLEGQLADVVGVPDDIAQVDRVEFPDGLATELEIACRERHRPYVEFQPRRRTVVLPAWISAWGARRRMIRIFVDARGRPTRMQAAVYRLPLWPQADDDKRTDRCQRWADRMLADLERVLGRAPSSESAWLKSAAKAPERAQGAALAAWSHFVKSFALEALRGWPLCFGDLEALSRTTTRHDFALRWTWVAFRTAKTDLHRLDAVDDVNTPVLLASKVLCCSGIEGCQKALPLARQFPLIDRKAQRIVFGVDDPYWAREREFRAVLFAAGDERLPLPARLQPSDDPELLRERPELLREQVKWAIDVVSELRIRSALVAVGGLIASVLVGTRSDPASLGRPATLASAFRRAAGCIVPFVPENANRTGDDEVCAAVSAVAAFFREQRITRQEIAEWSEAVVPAGNPEGGWPPPLGWTDEANEWGATRLRSTDEIREEGRNLDINLVYDSRYHYCAAAGDVHFFAFRSKARRPSLRGLRGTYSHERTVLVLREHRNTSGHVVNYSVVELITSFGMPSDSVSRKAKALLAYLRSKLPMLLSEEELNRRGLPGQLLHSVAQGRARPFCSDQEALASRVWRDLYAPALPERLRTSSPKQIAATKQTGVGECVLDRRD